MKRLLLLFLLFVLLLSISGACAEGLLPLLTDTIGKAMPSLGEALGRYGSLDAPALLEHRYQKFRRIGRLEEA